MTARLILYLVFFKKGKVFEWTFPFKMVYFDLSAGLFLFGGLNKIDAVFANIASFKHDVVIDIPAKGAEMTSSHIVFLLVLIFSVYLKGFT